MPSALGVLVLAGIEPSAAMGAAKEGGWRAEQRRWLAGLSRLAGLTAGLGLDACDLLARGMSVGRVILASAPALASVSRAAFEPFTAAAICMRTGTNLIRSVCVEDGGVLSWE